MKTLLVEGDLTMAEYSSTGLVGSGQAPITQPTASRADPSRRRYA